MLNPTLSDLIGGIQSVTLGDEEARRRRSQKSVLERKAPPTFDVVIEIQDRERVLVHGDVADTVDALLRGDPVAPGAALARRGGRASLAVAAAAVAARAARAGPLLRAHRAGGAGWRTEPGWRGEARVPRRRLASSCPGGGARAAVRVPAGRVRLVAARPGRRRGGRRRGAGPSRERRAEAPFVAGDIADRGPLERGTTPVPETRARDARELSRQREWRESATKAIDALKAEEGTGRSTPPSSTADDEALAGRRRSGRGRRSPRTARRSGSAEALPTLRVLPQGISRKRLEQAIRELQLPVIIARDVDEADVVMTIRSEYKQKTPMVREAEERAMPIYVLKTNTIPQMQSSLTSIFALEIDPRDAALRETEEAIGVVLDRAEAVELSPQNAYIRRLQHQMAERANLVSRSRGREPYRRVRLYPDPARSPWR